MTEQNKIIVSRPLRHSEVTPSGNYYPREVLEKMVQDWKAKTMPTFGTVNSGDIPAHMVDLTKVATVVEDMYVDDEGLVVHQRILDTPKGGGLEFELTQVKFSIAPKLSIVNTDGIVTNAVLYSFEFIKSDLVPASKKE